MTVSLVLVFFLVVGCAPATGEADIAVPEIEPTSTPANTPEPPTPTPPQPLPPKPEPTRVEFKAEDGTPLVGYFHPAPADNAPVIVLMHWAGGDQTDWTKVGLVDWLQNWPGTQAAAGFYPSMPSGVSFAVFTFDFRSWGESGGSFSGSGLVMDAKAAYEKAMTMPGVDASRTSGIGSSIGADGVVDACADCIGALSLSPGGYLGMDYSSEVARLDAMGVPVWCIASEGDSESFPTCKNAAGDLFKSIIYPGNAHGTMFLMEESAPPDIGQVILDWLNEVYEFQ
jgi:dienelactone hydrolase